MRVPFSNRALLQRLRRSGISPGSAIPSEELLRVYRAAAAGEASGAAFEGEWAADQSSFSSREIFANSEVAPR
jgi:hypothetical protein